MSQEISKYALLGGRHFEKITSDAGIEWLFSLASALQASQHFFSESSSDAERRSAIADPGSAIEEG